MLPSVVRCYLILLLSVLRLCKRTVHSFNITPLVVEGTTDDEYDLAKYYVSIHLANAKMGYGFFCGGSIIGERKILTAAHCLWDASRGRYHTPGRLMVVAGQRNIFKIDKYTQILTPAKLVRHQKFNRHTLRNDIAVILLKQPIDFTDRSRVDVITLTTRKNWVSQQCTAVGFGRLFYEGPITDILAFVDLYVLNDKQCTKYSRNFLERRMICAGYPIDWSRDSCTGDSGGPLICQNQLVGIVSFGYKCASSRRPGAYTSVYYYRSWINENSSPELGCLGRIYSVTFVVILVNCYF